MTALGRSKSRRVERGQVVAVGGQAYLTILRFVGGVGRALCVTSTLFPAMVSVAVRGTVPVLAATV